MPKLILIGQTPEELIKDYKSITEIVESTDIGRVVPNDPKDDKFVACAVGGKADAIITGDGHLLNDLGSF